MKSVCVTIRHLRSGGAEKQALLLAKLLTPIVSTHLVVLFDTKAEEKFVRYIKENNIKCTILEGSLITKILQFKNILVSEKIEFIFSYLFSDNVVSALLGRYLKIPYIISGERNTREDSSLKGILSRYLHNYVSTKTLFNSHMGKVYFTDKGYRADKAEVIQNGIELIPLQDKVQTEVPLQIVSTGRFVLQKDYPTALNAFAKLISTHNYTSSEINYTIIGYGALETEIRDLIKKLNLTNYVTLKINPPDVLSIVKNSDIFLLTSVYEGVSNAIMEAMSFALPVVATDVGDNKYLIEHGKSGYITSVGDSDTIANRLYDLISSEERREIFGKRGRKILEENFSEEAFLQKYLDFMESLEQKS